MNENDVHKLDRYRNEDAADLVHCAKCDVLINAYATRCPECGVHFRGEAYDFVLATGSRRPRAIRWIAWAAVVVLVVLAIGALLFCLR